MAEKPVEFDDLRMKNTSEKIDEGKNENSMKAAKPTDFMSKSNIAKALSAKCKHKKKDMLNVLDALMEMVIAEVKKNGKFALPGIATIKRSYKPGQRVGKIVIRAKQVGVKAKAEQNMIKAFGKNR